MAETIHPGGCACGALRYEVRGEPIFVNHCHCRLCQRQTGSVGVVNAFYESDRLTVTQGATTEHAFKAGSGGDHILCRCAECGTAVFSHYPRLERLGAGVRVGSFDDPGAFTPTAVVFTESKMHWAPLPEGIPAFEQYYSPKELLSEANFARLIALVEKKGAPNYTSSQRKLGSLST